MFVVALPLKAQRVFARKVAFERQARRPGDSPVPCLRPCVPGEFASQSLCVRLREDSTWRFRTHSNAYC